MHCTGRTEGWVQSALPRLVGIGCAKRWTTGSNAKNMIHEPLSVPDWLVHVLFYIFSLYITFSVPLSNSGQPSGVRHEFNTENDVL